MHTWNVNNSWILMNMRRPQTISLFYHYNVNKRLSNRGEFCYSCSFINDSQDFETELLSMYNLYIPCLLKDKWLTEISRYLHVQNRAPVLYTKQQFAFASCFPARFRSQF